MDEQTLDDLRDPSRWDGQAAEAHAPVKGPRAVVSVAFSREDFNRVGEQARALGMRTSEFIRKAALNRLEAGPAQAPSPGVRLIRVSVKNGPSESSVEERGPSIAGRDFAVEVELEPFPVVAAAKP
jgi:hypothetical protein